MDWCLREGYSWSEDKEHCEEYGRMLNADASKVSARAQQRGLPQMGTLGAGNHYAEIQVVDEIFDAACAKKMGVDRRGQVLIMVHSGSRGLGHQVASDSLVDMERVMQQYGIVVNDRWLCVFVFTQTARLCAHPLAGGTKLPARHGGGSQLRVGESVGTDFPHATGLQ